MSAHPERNHLHTAMCSQKRSGTTPSLAKPDSSTCAGIDHIAAPKMLVQKVIPQQVLSPSHSFVLYPILESCKMHPNMQTVANKALLQANTGDNPLNCLPTIRVPLKESALATEEGEDACADQPDLVQNRTCWTVWGHFHVNIRGRPQIPPLKSNLQLRVCRQIHCLN